MKFNSTHELSSEVPIWYSITGQAILSFWPLSSCQQGDLGEVYNTLRFSHGTCAQIKQYLFFLPVQLWTSISKAQIGFCGSQSIVFLFDSFIFAEEVKPTSNLQSQTCDTCYGNSINCNFKTVNFARNFLEKVKYYQDAFRANILRIPERHCVPWRVGSRGMWWPSAEKTDSGGPGTWLPAIISVCP